MLSFCNPILQLTIHLHKNYALKDLHHNSKFQFFTFLSDFEIHNILFKRMVDKETISVGTIW